MGQVPSGNAPGRGLNKDKDNKVCQKQMHSHFKKKEGSKKWEPPVPVSYTHLTLPTTPYV